jgi:hypothetical protein
MASLMNLIRKGEAAPVLKELSEMRTETKTIDVLTWTDEYDRTVLMLASIYKMTDVVDKIHSMCYSCSTMIDKFGYTAADYAANPMKSHMLDDDPVDRNDYKEFERPDWDDY